MKDKPANILIADENPLYADGLKAMLMTRKHLGTPDIVNSHHDVFGIMEKKDYDLLITSAPDLNKFAFDFIFKVRRYFPDVKLLLVLSENTVGVADDYILSQVNGHILKNSLPDEFFMLIEKTLQKGVIYNGDLF